MHSDGESAKAGPIKEVRSSEANLTFLLHFFPFIFVDDLELRDVSIRVKGVGLNSSIMELLIEYTARKGMEVVALLQSKQ